MKSPFKFIFGLAIASAAAGAASAQGWRGIEPIGSTCKDVERILGGSACGRQTTDYRLPDAYVRFVFSDRPCDPKWPYEQYDVPPGTVTWFVMIPRYPTRLFVSDLKLDVSKFGRGDPEDMLNAVVYLSSELGLKITAGKDSGEIGDITYSPPSKYDHHRCPRPAEAETAGGPMIYGLSSMLVGEYDPASPERESEQLKKLVAELRQWERRLPGEEGRETLIYVIAYAGRRAREGEARSWAARAEQALVKEHGIDKSRVRAVDGGHRGSPVVQLFLKPDRGSAPTVEPTVHPNEVQIIKGRTSRRRSRP